MMMLAQSPAPWARLDAPQAVSQAESSAGIRLSASGLRVSRRHDRLRHAALHAVERNLLYTAITRGRKRVVVVAEKKALAMAVGNGSAGQRLTILHERLIRLSSGPPSE